MLKYNFFFYTSEGTINVSILQKKRVCVLITPGNHARFYLRAPFFLIKIHFCLHSFQECYVTVLPQLPTCGK